MKTIRLIKAQNQQPARQNAADYRQPVQVVVRESVLEWVREYHVSKHVNPRAQFAKLFVPAV